MDNARVAPGPDRIDDDLHHGLPGPSQRSRANMRDWMRSRIPARADHDGGRR